VYRDKENLRGVTLIVAMAFAFGATFGLTTPLLSLVMESWGVRKAVIGANAAMPGLAALFLAPLFPALAARLGLRPLLYVCLTVLVGTLLIFPLLTGLWIWFPLRFVNGAAAIGLFVISEFWINSVALDATRGRIIAIYTTAISLGWMLGAMLLPAFGIQGWSPFVAGAFFIVLAGIPLLFLKVAPPPIQDHTHFRFRSFLSEAPLASGAVLISGVLYMGGAALLPAYALMMGLDTAAAARTVAWLAFGQLALPLITGVMLDRYAHRQVLLFLAVAGCVLFWLFPVLFGHTVSRAVALFLMGGLVMSLYSISLTLLGDRFKGAHLAGAMAGVTIMFSIGELFGPVLVGVAMDVRPVGFSVSIALMVSAYLLLIVISRRKV
jgi:MFS family permease